MQKIKSAPREKSESPDKKLLEIYKQNSKQDQYKSANFEPSGLQSLRKPMQSNDTIVEEPLETSLFESKKDSSLLLGERQGSNLL